MTKQLAVVGNWTTEDMQTMKDTLAVGTNDSQFQLFLRTAHASGLNPFLNHIYAITYQGKMSLQIGIEGIAYLAKQKDGFQGYDAQVVYEGEEFKPKRLSDGTWEILHEMDGFPSTDAKILGAYAVAYREGFKPYTVIMPWSEVEHFQKSSIPNQQTMWKKYTADMFKKHVLKRALKGQFGIDINEDDAINQEPNINNVESYTRVDVTPEATHTTQQEVKATKTQQKQQTAPKEPTAAEKAQMEKNLMDEVNANIKANFFKLGIEDSGVAAYMQGHFPQLKEGDKLTYPQKQQLLRIMEAEIELKSELVDSLE